jgi:hypothetical protein
MVVQQRGRPAATRWHAYFYPNWSTLTSVFSASSYRIFLIFDSKKKLVSFSLIYINCLRDCGVVVQQSLPLPCRWGEHMSRGLSRLSRRTPIVWSSRRACGSIRCSTSRCWSLLPTTHTRDSDPTRRRRLRSMESWSGKWTRSWTRAGRAEGETGSWNTSSSGRDMISHFGSPPRTSKSWRLSTGSTSGIRGSQGRCLRMPI